MTKVTYKRKSLIWSYRVRGLESMSTMAGASRQAAADSMEGAVGSRRRRQEAASRQAWC